jgi:hypothetical protein
MKVFITFLITTFSFLNSFAQTIVSKPLILDKTKEVLLVDASCGQCKLGLPGKSCDLAISLNGKSYFVDGTEIDSHGDAHAKDGFCNSIRKANVQGEIVNDRFKATYFTLLPDTPKK